ncbi:MAG: glycosyltransferase [Phycisphaerales bacterium]|nr:glycosyltransferase [Phycisphaerales bacterium]
MNGTRITYVITDLDVGGVPLHLARLAHAIREFGFLPRVVSLAPIGAIGERLVAAGISIESCYARGPSDVGVIARLSRLLCRHRPSLVHAFLFHANLAACLAAPLAGISSRRVICEIQTVEIERPWHLTVGGMTHRMCACVVGNSPSVVEHLRQRAHMAASRLCCISGGVDVAAIQSAQPLPRAELGVDDDCAIVLWVGRLDPVKGLDELLAAFRIVDTGRRTMLLLVGDGPYRPRVESMIREYGLGNRVRLLGRRSDVAEVMKTADVFAFPSRTEGMPNALLEAMAAGLAAVATDVAGCRDVVVDGETGLLVPGGDVGALTAAMRRLLVDDGLRRALGARAARHAGAQYSFHRCVTRYAALYDRVLREVPLRVI